MTYWHGYLSPIMECWICFSLLACVEGPCSFLGEGNRSNRMELLNIVGSFLFDLILYDLIQELFVLWISHCIWIYDIEHCRLGFVDMWKLFSGGNSLHLLNEVKIRKVYTFGASFVPHLCMIMGHCTWSISMCHHL